MALAPPVHICIRLGLTGYGSRTHVHSYAYGRAIVTVAVAGGGVHSSLLAIQDRDTAAPSYALTLSYTGYSTLLMWMMSHCEWIGIG